MFNSSSPSPDFEPLSRSQILIAMGGTAIILLAVARIWINWGKVEILPLAWTWKHLVWGIALGFGITLASAVVYQIWPSYRSAANQYLMLVLQPLIWADVIWLGLLPGLSEELLFRGVMLSAFGLNLIALFISSLCFGVLHMGNRYQWPYVVWATAVGAVLGYTALKTESLLIPVSAHIVTNWLAGIIWKMKHPQTSSLGKSGDPS